MAFLLVAVDLELWRKMREKEQQLNGNFFSYRIVGSIVLQQCRGNNDSVMYCNQCCSKARELISEKLIARASLASRVTVFPNT